jgi:outer membrane lipoprotein carrier protein
MMRMTFTQRVGRVVGMGALLLAFVSLRALAADAAPDGRARIDKFLNGLTGLRADFTQKLADQSGRTIEESNGTLAIRRPNRFRWDYTAPNEQVIVADGTRVWLYDKDLEQVTVRKLDDTLSATPAMLLSGEGKLDDNFNVVKSEANGNVVWVILEPKRKDTDFKSVRLAFVGDALGSMVLSDKLGQTTTLMFSKFERNPTLDPARFTFTPPPGADVIGDPSATPQKK